MRIKTTDIKVGYTITTAIGTTMEVTYVSPVRGNGRFYVEGKVAGDRATCVRWMNSAGSVTV
jgi:hypothetical protein